MSPKLPEFEGSVSRKNVQRQSEDREKNECYKGSRRILSDSSSFSSSIQAGVNRNVPQKRQEAVCINSKNEKAQSKQITVLNANEQSYLTGSGVKGADITKRKKDSLKDRSITLEGKEKLNPESKKRCSSVNEEGIGRQKDVAAQTVIHRSNCGEERTDEVNREILQHSGSCVDILKV